MESPLCASREVLSYVAELPVRSHTIFVYDTEPVATSILESFVSGGVIRNQATFIVTDSLDAYSRLLRSNGLRNYARDKRLNHMTIEQFYFKNGKFATRMALESARALLKDSMFSGFDSIRIVICGGNFSKHLTPQELVAHEIEIGRNLTDQITVMCSYDARLLKDDETGDLLVELLKAHGRFVFKGLASQGN